MKKADMHCHSLYSEYQTEKWLRKMGMHEPYNDPLVIYQQAKNRGMDYVTLTDRNNMEGVLLLKEQHPKDVITGVEATTAFPEDNCRIHVLVWGLNEYQFNELSRFRKDIYQFRECLLSQGLAYSIAHPTFAVNGRLKRHHLEKLLLLFDVFEGINGKSSKFNNEGWQQILMSLTPELLEDLYVAHRIEPTGKEPWKKGLTGGSDDTGELFLGSIWTAAYANNPTEFLQQIRSKSSVCEGSYYTYQAMALNLIKLGTESKSFSKANLWKVMSEKMFSDTAADLSLRFKIKALGSIAKSKISRHIFDQVDKQTAQNGNQNNKSERLFEVTANLVDTYLKELLGSLEKSIKGSKRKPPLRVISSSLPGIITLLPFYLSLKDMPYTRDLLTELKSSRNINTTKRPRRTLWFTDTVTDLNGVSVIIKCAAKAAVHQNRELKVVSCLAQDKLTPDVPVNYINLPALYDFQLPFYEQYCIQIPSVMQSLKIIDEYNPDQIIISTPGTLGLLGLLAAKLLQVDCTVIYHTDLLYEAEHIMEDEYALDLLRAYERWFHNQANEIRVPTAEYIRILADRDIHVGRTKLLKRGIETDIFIPLADRKAYLSAKLGIWDGITLFYAGRISPDKSLDLMAKVYLDLVKEKPDLNLIIAGDGVYMKDLKALLKGQARVHFTGPLPREELVYLYNAADFFIFPSVTDTFGLVVMEAQACGLPAIVSAEGGPQEVIIPDQTGYIVPNQQTESWLAVTRQAIEMYETNPALYEEMRAKSREAVLATAGWEEVLDDLCGDKMV